MTRMALGTLQVLNPGWMDYRYIPLYSTISTTSIIHKSAKLTFDHGEGTFLGVCYKEGPRYNL